MVKISIKRETPEEDVERLAEKIYNESRGNIVDIDSFNEQFDEYMGELKGNTGTTLRKKVFTKMIDEHKSIVAERLHPKKGRPKKETEILEDKRVKPKFVYLRYSKNKVVYAREEKLVYKIKKKEIKRIIYRDRFGRFTSSKSLRERKGIKIHKVV